MSNSTKSVQAGFIFCPFLSHSRVSFRYFQFVAEFYSHLQKEAGFLALHLSLITFYELLYCCQYVLCLSLDHLTSLCQQHYGWLIRWQILGFYHQSRKEICKRSIGGDTQLFLHKLGRFSTIQCLVSFRTNECKTSIIYPSLKYNS